VPTAGASKLKSYFIRIIPVYNGQNILVKTVKFMKIWALLIATVFGIQQNVESIDKYSKSGNIMTLNKAHMAPVARFEAMFLK
jgi:hypothetical protein